MTKSRGLVQPFRAEHVGSLLRDERLVTARERAFSGEIPMIGLRAVEDLEIERIVRRQEEIGLRVVTDGEFRRTHGHFDFFAGLDGVSLPSVHGSSGPTGGGGSAAPTTEHPVVVGKLGFTSHPMVRQFAYLRHLTTGTPKISLPAPSVLHFRGGRQAVPAEVYPDLDEFFDDIGYTYRQVVRAFANAGCRYLQLDEPSLACLCDPEQRQIIVDRGEDPAKLMESYIRAVNIAVSDIPEDMTVAMHIGRGHDQSNGHAACGYDHIAESAFQRLNVDGFLLEYDTEPAGGFEPLRQVPAGKRVVLGLVTTKNGTLEDRDALLRRLEDASSHIPIHQLCLGPERGFAGVDKGVLTEDDQWRKLDLVVSLAAEVWEDA